MRIAAAAVMSRKQNHLKTNVIFFVSVVMLLLPAQKLRFESGKRKIVNLDTTEE